MQAQAFLQQKFADYYKANFVQGPPDISLREFGVGEFGKKISARHLSFADSAQLNSFLREKSPFYISYSAAYYELPQARPMSEKKMIKSDLIYEFDADDIMTECKVSHDSWACSCGAAGKGSVSNCSKCGLGVKVDEWVCPQCLLEIKKQVSRLVSFLENDFGISGGFYFNYSGSKGFHIHIRGESVWSISPSGRVELVDYLTAHDLGLSNIGFVFSKNFFSPRLSKSLGWQKIILGSLVELFEAGDAQKIAALGNVSVRTANALLGKKKSVLEGFENGVLVSLSGSKTKPFWESLISFVVSGQMLGLDRQTSIDSFKIIRVPNTLHGSTGLLAKEFPFEKLGEFDALSECVAFGSLPVRLKSVSAPKFYLGKQWWGPFAGEEVELPEFVAVYLAAKGHAQVV